MEEEIGKSNNLIEKIFRGGFVVAVVGSILGAGIQLHIDAPPAVVRAYDTTKRTLSELEALKAKSSKDSTSDNLDSLIGELKQYVSKTENSREFIKYEKNEDRNAPLGILIPGAFMVIWGLSYAAYALNDYEKTHYRHKKG